MTILWTTDVCVGRPVWEWWLIKDLSLRSSPRISNKQHQFTTLSQNIRFSKHPIMHLVNIRLLHPGNISSVINMQFSNEIALNVVFLSRKGSDDVYRIAIIPILFVPGIHFHRSVFFHVIRANNRVCAPDRRLTMESNWSEVRRDLYRWGCSR